MVKPIYAPLKWVDAVSYILAIGCVVAVLVVHFVARLLFRRWKMTKLKERDGKDGLLRSQVTEDISEEIEIEAKENNTFRKTV